jgi:hypothetical protein
MINHELVVKTHTHTYTPAKQYAGATRSVAVVGKYCPHQSIIMLLETDICTPKVLIF